MKKINIQLPLSLRNLTVLTLVLLSTLFLSSSRSFAQSKRAAISVTVEKSTSGKGSIVSISSDTSLGQAQTWQDKEGFHVFIPNGFIPDSAMPGKEIRVRLIGQSLELMFQPKSGARVDVQHSDTRLELRVDGELEVRAPDSNGSVLGSGQNATNGSPVGNQLSAGADTAKGRSLTRSAQVTAEDYSFLSAVFSGTGLLVVSALGLFGVLVSRKMYSVKEVNADPSQGAKLLLVDDASEDSSNMMYSTDNDEDSRSRVITPPVSFASSAHGPYRISHEVNCLIGGQHHRSEVLASSDPGDRRAIEAALLQVLSSSKYDQGARARVRSALERYGFVARQCAALLRAPEAFERSSAARSLGEIACPASMPFLLEALHDSDLIVRNQAVTSLGRLQLPGAVDALRDMARRHPDLRQVISNALKLCSEGNGNVHEFVYAVSTLAELAPEEELPLAGENLDEPLLGLLEENPDRRLEAIKELGTHRVQEAVNALCEVACNDPETAVRSLAIAKLGVMDHESVLPAILTGMADSSREVRAAAARSMSRLRFDRAEAYARLLETADQDSLEKIANACFESGLVSQNIDRLINRDRRQGYEVFTLMCLLTKAGRVESTVELIAKHPKQAVREIAIHLLARTGGPILLDEFRRLASKDDIPADVKKALLEPLGETEQPTAAASNSAEENVTVGDETLTSHEDIDSPAPDSSSLPLSNTEFEIATDDLSC